MSSARELRHLLQMYPETADRICLGIDQVLIIRIRYWYRGIELWPSPRGQTQSTPDSDECNWKEDCRKRDTTFVHSIGCIQEGRILYTDKADSLPLSLWDTDLSTATEKHPGECNQLRENNTESDN